jgi:hypothetical protein
MGLRPRDVDNALSKSLTNNSEDSGDLVNRGLLYPWDVNILLGILREYLIYLLLGKPVAWPSF